jgi:hypothetical protein
MDRHFRVGARLRLAVGLSIVAAGCVAALTLIAMGTTGAAIAPVMMLAAMLGAALAVLLAAAIAALLRGIGPPRGPEPSPHHRQA